MPRSCAAPARRSIAPVARLITSAYRSVARNRQTEGVTMDVDPTHIRSLQAIVRYGGYGRAAEALYLTQPAVSRHVRLLEEQLGSPLFVRRGRGVELTPF